MQLKVTQNNLNNCLKNVILFVDKGHQLDVIKNINLKVSKNIVEVSATNLEIAIIEKVQCSSKKDGEISISPDILKNYIQNIPPDEIISIEEDQTKLKIVRKGDEATINGIINKNPVAIPSIAKKNPILKLKAAKFKKIINQVIFAANKDLNKAILTSCILSIRDNNLYLAATDSYRLAEKKIDNETKNSLDKETQILIPASTLAIVEKIISNYLDEYVSVYVNKEEKTILFSPSETDIDITSTLIEDNPLDYQKLLPEKYATEIMVPKQDLIDIVQRINVFSQKNLNSISLEWEAGGKTLNIASSSQIGQGREKIPATFRAQPKENMSISVNAKFLQDVLRVLEGDKTTISCNGPLEPVLITDHLKDGKIDTSYRYIIMPLKS